MKCHEKEVSWLLHNYTLAQNRGQRRYYHIFPFTDYSSKYFYNIFIYSTITYNQW